MPRKSDILRLTFCGPSDVKKEIGIAGEVVDSWNTQHADGLGLIIKKQHWTTDAFPDASQRGQAVINSQLIDSADILVCIFWSRFGSPTGVAESGTKEEIMRGIAAGKHVAVYFSGLEPLPVDTLPDQLRQLDIFRKEMFAKSLSWTFQSRTSFRDLFTVHLAKIVHQLRPKPTPEKPTRRTASPRKVLNQQIRGGNGNLLVGGDVQNLNHFASPPKVSVVVERPPGCISPKQGQQLHEWIKNLVEDTTNQNQSAAYKHWWRQLKKKFGVAKYELILAEDFPAVQAWYRQQKGILTRNLKAKLPDQYRKSRIGSIKGAMIAMGLIKEDYYPELAHRLRIPNFGSLSELTKSNLDRVYSRVMDDRRKF